MSSTIGTDHDCRIETGCVDFVRTTETCYGNFYHCTSNFSDREIVWTGSNCANVSGDNQSPKNTNTICYCYNSSATKRIDCEIVTSGCRHQSHCCDGLD